MKTSCLPDICPATAKFAFPRQDPDAVLKGLRGEDRLFAQCELAVLRCDFAAAKDLYGRLSKSPRYFASATRFGVIAAIGLGDVRLFDDVIRVLTVLRRTAKDALTSVLVDLAEGWIHQWMWIQTGYPEWISLYDFEDVPEAWRDSAAYLGAKIYLVRGQFESAYAAAALMMHYVAPDKNITVRDVYLMMTRAMSCRERGRRSEMMKWLRAAVNKVAPHGMLLPLFMFLHGGAKSPVEEVLEEVRPDLLPRFREQNRSYYKNLILVRNHYLGERITDKLTFREMYLAIFLKRGRPYDELAKRFEVTVGHLKNVISKVYEKLGVHSRGELKDIVW